MEQKDYILREAEKIAVLLNALLKYFIGGDENVQINIDKYSNKAKDLLLKELNFDLDKFVQMDFDESKKYLDSFEGFNIENIEQLAEFISQIGFSDKTDKSKKHLNKALQLYELTSIESKTYSFDRERKIIILQDVLNRFE